MPLVVSTPGAVVAADEGGDLPNKPVVRWSREPGDDGPVITDVPNVRCVASGGAPLEVAEVDGKHAAGAERFRDRGQRTPYSGFVTQIVQDVPDRNDRIRVRERVVREHDLADVFRISGNVACQLEHRRRRVSRHNAMSSVEEMPGENTTPTADLNDQASSLAYGLEPLQDAWCASVGMEAQPTVMHERQIPPVVQGVGSHQNMMLALRPQGVTAVRLPYVDDPV